MQSSLTPMENEALFFNDLFFISCVPTSIRLFYVYMFLFIMLKCTSNIWLIKPDSFFYVYLQTQYLSFFFRLIPIQYLYQNIETHKSFHLLHPLSDYMYVLVFFYLFILIVCTPIVSSDRCFFVCTYKLFFI
jgi:hypothetical protein